MSKSAAIEILIFRPFHLIPESERKKTDTIPSPIERGVHENLWIKQRFKQYLSIGVYQNKGQLQYYLFDQVDAPSPKRYDSLVALKSDLPDTVNTLFNQQPHLFLMGHGHGGIYGLSNIHGPSENIHDDLLDTLLNHFKAALPLMDRKKAKVTLEGCNTDNQQLAIAKGYKKTFLERLSSQHPSITFSGTGPWDPNHNETGHRASGGFPQLTTPITSMVGGVWKSGNRVIFHHEQQQMAAKKSMFSTTDTTKAIKINTIKYAVEILESIALTEHARKKILADISLNRDIVTIEELNSLNEIFYLPHRQNPKITSLLENEAAILEREKRRYLSAVEKILTKSEAKETISDRESLLLTLGLKSLSIFQGHERLLNRLEKNNQLLESIMVSCGKVLIAGPDNNDIIDFLLQHGVDIDSRDQNGMTALHYAAQNFFHYRKEPLQLIKLLISHGANLNSHNHQGKTPLDLALTHCEDKRVMEGEVLLSLLRTKESELRCGTSALHKQFDKTFAQFRMTKSPTQDQTTLSEIIEQEETPKHTSHSP